MPKTRQCIYGDHIVVGEDADMMGRFVEEGFVCNAHLHLHEDGVDPDDWTGEEEDDEGENDDGEDDDGEDESEDDEGERRRKKEASEMQMRLRGRRE